MEHDEKGERFSSALGTFRRESKTKLLLDTDPLSWKN